MNLLFNQANNVIRGIGTFFAALLCLSIFNLSHADPLGGVLCEENGGCSGSFDIAGYAVLAYVLFLILSSSKKTIITCSIFFLLPLILVFLFHGNFIFSYFAMPFVAPFISRLICEHFNIDGAGDAARDAWIRKVLKFPPDTSTSSGFPAHPIAKNAPIEPSKNALAKNSSMNVPHTSNHVSQGKKNSHSIKSKTDYSNGEFYAKWEYDSCRNTLKNLQTGVVFESTHFVRENSGFSIARVDWASFYEVVFTNNDHPYNISPKKKIQIQDN